MVQNMAIDKSLPCLPAVVGSSADGEMDLF